jgi:hypothetical protein
MAVRYALAGGHMISSKTFKYKVEESESTFTVEIRELKNGV